MNYQSTIFSKYLGDEQLNKIVSDETLIKNILAFENALAVAHGNISIIPTEAANEIKTLLSKIFITPQELVDDTFKNGVPVVGLVNLIREKLSNDAKKYFHFGATSQDAMDTAFVLMIRETIDVIEHRISELIGRLTQLNDQYGETICMARTRSQQAIPIEFGMKISSWIRPLNRHQERLAEIRKRTLSVELGGATGNNAVYGSKGDQLISSIANELGLTTSNPWHTQRDNFCEFTNWLAMVSGALGKMGADILIMSQSEINEVNENVNGGGKSSSMTHKNNPVLSEALVALSRINAGLQSQQLQSLVHGNERDATAWILEWNAIPQMILNTGTALNHSNTIIAHIRINTEIMQAHVLEFKKRNS